MQTLNIMHVLRAPVGGLFRHVLDLTHEQVARGHHVGIVADSRTGGEHADEVLHALAPSLALGLSRVPMWRHGNPADLWAFSHVMHRIAEAKADVVHGHGAKGGAYARLSFGRRQAVRAYTPHGGSLLFGHDTLAGQFYLAAERLLMLRGDLFLFESAYSEEVFRRKIGNPKGLVRVVHNGVSSSEFTPILVRNTASDLVFLGELRPVKGVDVLIDAIAILHREGRAVTATLVGSGPERGALEAQVQRLGLAAAVCFKPAMPAREALSLGRIMVVPSRSESLPYVVLETAAAGKPLIATRVGGVPEIYGPLADRLVPPRDAAALARAIAETLDDPRTAANTAAKLRERVAASFSVQSMVDGVLAGYRDALQALQKAGRR
jgi:glycosyltransferase involved in cell wall biosynthesis